MRRGLIDWAAMVLILFSAIVGAIMEKETDGGVTQIIMYQDTNKTTCIDPKVIMINKDQGCHQQ